MIKRNEQGEVTNVFITGVSRFTDAGLVHLQELTNLTNLDRKQTQIIDAAITELKQALPNLQIEK
jgi:hypothetical protein